jgi:hypothetical protein
MTRPCVTRSRSLFEIAQDATEFYGGYKRPWCQPWTILLTGSSIITVSWKLFKGWSSVLAFGATGAILLWWYLFLVEYPALIKENPGLLDYERDLEKDLDDRNI